MDIKWQITIFSTFVFLLVVNTYGFTHKLFSGLLGPILIQGQPTLVGLALHTIMYMLIVRYSMDMNLFKGEN